MTPKENANPERSEKTGLSGFYENVLRKFRTLVMVLTLLALYGVVAVLLGVSLIPAIAIVGTAFERSSEFATFPQYFVRGVSIVLGFLAYGFAAIFVVPVANLIVRPFLKPFRGPAYSVSVFGWYVHNVFIYALRYTFLEWITPSPFNQFFYRNMGMKVGRYVEINTTNISDAAYITLEDRVIIGGSATLLAHYAVGGYLVISPVVIRKNATIGLRAIVMGGVEIGEGAKVLPNSVVLPKTKIPDGETWGGIPAVKLNTKLQSDAARLAPQ